MGRPTKLDEAAANTIVAVLERGLTIEDACEAAGITSATFRFWVSKGDRFSKRKEPTEEERKYSAFSAAIKRSRSLGKISLVDVLQRAATDPHNPNQVKAAMWLLERMHPAQFGRRYIRLEMSDPEGNPVSSVPPPEVRIVIEGGQPQHPPIVEDNGQ